MTPQEPIITRSGLQFIITIPYDQAPSDLKEFDLQYQVASDNTSWGDWKDIGTFPARDAPDGGKTGVYTHGSRDVVFPLPFYRYRYRMRTAGVEYEWSEAAYAGEAFNSATGFDDPVPADDLIIPGTITGDLIGDDEIDESLIAPDAVGPDEIQFDAITADHIQTITLDAGQIYVGATISGSTLAGTISAGAIRAGNIHAQAFEGNEFSLASGGLFRTGASGSARLVLGTVIPTSAGNKSGLVGMDSSNNITMHLDPTTGNVNITGTVNIVTGTGLGNFTDTATPAQVPISLSNPYTVFATTSTSSTTVSISPETTVGMQVGASVVSTNFQNNTQVSSIVDTHHFTVNRTPITNGSLTATIVNHSFLINGLVSSTIAVGALAGDRIVGNTITANHLVANSVDTSQLVAGAITSKHTLTAATIQNNTNAGFSKTIIDNDGLYVLDVDGIRVVQIKESLGAIDIKTTTDATPELQRRLRFMSTSGNPLGQLYTREWSETYDTHDYDRSFYVIGQAGTSGALAMIKLLSDSSGNRSAIQVITDDAGSPAINKLLLDESGRSEYMMKGHTGNDKMDWAISTIQNWPAGQQHSPTKSVSHDLNQIPTVVLVTMKSATTPSRSITFRAGNYTISDFEVRGWTDTAFTADQDVDFSWVAIG